MAKKLSKSFLAGGKLPGLSSKGGHHKSSKSHHTKASPTPKIKPGKGFRGFKGFGGF